MIPPLWLWVHVESPTDRPVRLWLPLFLVWLLLLPFFVIALAATALTDVVLLLAGVAYHRYTMLLLGCCRLLAETRGLVVRVNRPGTVVDVTIA
jgi:hypothetical protein